ncbi:hypothetical protein HDU98_008648 [Podochytrium sp. JEL0797]|nr:hypothetical protein HDU98_008648 [Podochytrium sp. JEL0797]
MTTRKWIAAVAFLCLAAFTLTTFRFTRRTSTPSTKPSQCPPPHSKLVLLSESVSPSNPLSVWIDIDSDQFAASTSLETLYASDRVKELIDSLQDAKPEVVVQVGAGIGIDALLLARRGHQVHALETDPSLFALMACTAVSNHFPNLHTIHSSPSTNLMTYLTSNNIHPTHLLLSTSGSEFPTLQQTHAFLSLNPPAHIFSNLILSDMRERQVDPEAYLDFLVDSGYTVKLVFPSRAMGTNRMPVKKWRELEYGKGFGAGRWMELREYDEARLHAYR